MAARRTERLRVGAAINERPLHWWVCEAARGVRERARGYARSGKVQERREESKDYQTEICVAWTRARSGGKMVGVVGGRAEQEGRMLG
eukprot:6186876-Pleurochrysis_carterae.AAC.3